MLTKFTSHEETIWCEVYLRGKDVLNLFVYLKGSCQFIRRSVLDQLKGFDEKALSEDMEFSARLAQSGYKIRYAPNVQAWQESPASAQSFFRQRTRWFRGTMELALRYGRLMSKPSMRNFDAELTLLGPFVLMAGLAVYLATFYSFFVRLPFSLLLQLVMQASGLMTTFTFLLCGLALVYASKPRRAKSMMWVPFIYFYWGLQAFISFYAAMLIMLRRPRSWNKTVKTGAVNEAYVLQACA
jgi:cellulose synthase/poly-beta-1,6-N-acetylglucosamine synthase-like glycosyltransferase